ncbi:MAG: alcohol dehydrogenase catalytic domain-containing protein [Chloroflexi bacterium]|nr:alcohol dehydrogenase catalytic domain-containing protein [Chloroflexota bacterium]
MRQAVMTAPGEIVIHEIESPEPGPGEVLLRIQCIGVCGSDVHVFHGKHPYTSYPVVQGHEFSATLESVGEGVTGMRSGMKVTAMPQIVCGACAPCLRGDYHICDNLKVQGFQAPGCAQELWVTDADKIVPLPDSFSFEQGALVEPVSVAVHAVSRAGKLNGRNVAVLGAGPIGNLVGQVARADGAQVLITDLSDYRLEIARRCGLGATSNAARETLAEAAASVFYPDGFDMVFECVGAVDTMTAAIENIQKGGTIVIVGVFGDKPRVDLGLVQDRELNLRGTLMYRRPDYERAVELIDSGAVITTPLLSKHFTLDEYLAAYHFIDAQRDKTMKVIIDMA